MAITKSLKMLHLKCPFRRETFQPKVVRTLIEKLCEGRTLNLFSGNTKLNINEIRVDIDPTMAADFHVDAYSFITQYKSPPFETVLLDPPESYRKTMDTFYSKVMSRFNALKNEIPGVLTKTGLVITIGHQSISMGTSRNFHLERLVIVSHSGAIPDTLISIERRIKT